MLNRTAIVLTLVASSLLCTQAMAQVELDEKMFKFEGKKDRYFEAGMQEYGIGGGFGFADEDEFITDFLLLPKWGLFIADFDKIAKGAFEFEIEPVLGMHLTPSQAVEAGLNVLFTLNFETGTRFVPFFQFGAGFLYTDLRVNELGSRFNGSPQGGPGIKYMLSDRSAISLQTRIRHISNAGTASPNRGVDSLFFLIGMDFYR